MASGPDSTVNIVLLETDSVFALSVEDKIHSNLQALSDFAKSHQIQLKILTTALWEFNVVLLSQGRTSSETMNALVLVKAELDNLRIIEYSIGIEDLILTNKLRMVYRQLTYFDSLHVATSRRLGLPLVSSDKICQELFDNVTSFDEILK